MVSGFAGMLFREDEYQYEQANQSYRNTGGKGIAELITLICPWKS